MLKRLVLVTLALLQVAPAAVWAAKGKEKPKAAKEEEKKELMAPGTFTGLGLRAIGPAVTSGRIVDLAVDPQDPKTYFVAAASGGVWKTTNNGTTWAPVFDRQSSYSIGTVVLDPRNPNVVWVGSGENNSQRSVGYGDGVYKSLDGGKSWENVGLKASEHIGKILIDPRDSDVVFVAAQGPLWGPGGDRGLYKTTDGGKTWKKVLEISENTGVTDVVLDPRNPDTLYAAAYQRRRHVWTLIDGGPESAIYKSVDGGANWRKLSSGLPGVEMGRIGLAISTIDPDVLYATVEAQSDAGGFFRSANRGESWEKMSSTMAGSPQYYQELFVDPHVFDRVYLVDLYVMVTDDGGKSFRRLGERFKHVDNHVVWVDPHDGDHLLVGCDGGLYESWDQAATWNFKANLPITQFYRVVVDDSQPFYYVYGGTQDNFSLGGPSRTTSANGITNADWFVTQGGDGFESAVEPGNPNIVYAESQYGGIVRFDRQSGEGLDIQPQPMAAGESFAWNWDSPLLVSPHSPTRLYFAANKLFRSDDRGNTWKAVSPDLSRQIDRNKLPVMGKVWSIDAVAKNASTSLYGSIVALAESPKVEGLLYAGTDDGLIQVSEDGGANWRKVETFPGIPDRTYVAFLVASQHDDNTVYAAFDNHKMADFKPYVLKSADRGRTWTAITGNLPERGTVYSLAEDHVDADLLFAGTEFGLFFSNDGGKKWVQLKGGLPTIAVRDLAIQKRENDLVLATFGRGFYVLDDYSPLRHLDAAAVEKGDALLPVKDALMYVERAQLGLPKQGFQGHSLYTAANPDVGAVFTYYLKEDAKSRKDKRQEAEKKLADAGSAIPYPSWDDLRAEEREEAPKVVLTVRDEDGRVVRRLDGPAAAGVHRVSWDFRYPAANPTRLNRGGGDNIFGFSPTGPLAAPGRYTVSLERVVDGKTEALGTPQSFNTVPLANLTLPAPDRTAVLAFQQKTSRLQRAVLGAAEALEEAQTRVAHIKQALVDTPAAGPELSTQASAIENQLKDLAIQLVGDELKASHNEAFPPSIADRVQGVVYGHWYTTVAPTTTFQQNYQVAAEAFDKVLQDLTKVIEGDLVQLETQMEKLGAPFTPGRLPRWHPE